MIQIVSEGRRMLFGGRRGIRRTAEKRSFFQEGEHCFKSSRYGLATPPTSHTVATIHQRTPAFIGTGRSRAGNPAKKGSFEASRPQRPSHAFTRISGLLQCQHGSKSCSVLAPDGMLNMTVQYTSIACVRGLGNPGA